MSDSQSLFQRALKRIPGGVNSPVRAFGSVGGEPFFTASANGCHLTTVDGESLIDYVGTWGPAIHGHNNPEIKKAVTKALDAGTSFGTPNLYEVPMAELICECYPSIEKVRMVNSGTEATMTCIRLARGFANRDKIIKFEGCYHGHSDALLVKAGSGALTHGNPDSSGVTEGAARDTLLLPFNDVAALRRAFENNPLSIAAVILEPYPANMGLVLPKPGFLRELRELCTRNATLLIFDEVMTGFRVSLGGVQQLTGIRPDLTALGKIIGGGLPVGAFGGRSEIMEFLAPRGQVYQAGTLSGNPLALAAGIQSISMLRDQSPYQQLEEACSTLAKAILDAFARKGIAVQVPHTGSMLSLFFSETPVTSYAEVLASGHKMFGALFQACLKRGLFLPPSAFETWFISTSHDASVIEQSAEILELAIQDI